MININLIKRLRKKTGLGILECKKALYKANENFDLAVLNMRKEGKIKALNKINNITLKGVVLSKTNDSYGAIVEVNCETDFVAKNKSFLKFVDDILFIGLKEKIDNKKDLINKFEKKRIDLIAQTGENIQINRYFFMSGKIIKSYVHNKKIAVLVSGKDINLNLLKEISMHIAASNPKYLNQKNIPSKVWIEENNIQLEIAKKLSKKKEIIKKIASGRIQKIFNEITLMNQNFIINPKKTVKEILKYNKAEITKFVRFELGEKK